MLSYALFRNMPALNDLKSVTWPVSSILIDLGEGKNFAILLTSSMIAHFHWLIYLEDTLKAFMLGVRLIVISVCHAACVAGVSRGGGGGGGREFANSPPPLLLRFFLPNSLPPPHPLPFIRLLRRLLVMRQVSEPYCI